MNQNIRIFVINLKRSPERRDFMSKQFKKLEVDFEFIDAVDGQLLSEAQRKLYSKEKAVKFSGRELSDNEIGCFLSHAQIWQMIVEEDIKDALIMEDDIIPSKDLFLFLKNKQYFIKHWEMINFYSDTPQKLIKANIESKFHFTKFKYFANRTGCYLLNRSGARKLLDNAYPIRYAADGLTGRTYITNITMFGVSPHLVKLTKFESDIWNKSIGNTSYNSDGKINLWLYDRIMFWNHKVKLIFKK